MFNPYFHIFNRLTTTRMGYPRGKFRVRIRKMRPEPITIRRREAWGKPDKEETVFGTIFVSLFCFKILRVSRRNKDSDEHGVPTTDPEQVQVRYHYRYLEYEHVASVDSEVKDCARFVVI